MDPNATLCEIVSCFQAKEWEACQEACYNMRYWLTSGGFRPTGYSRKDMIGFCTIMFRLCQSAIERESLERSESDS